MKLSKFEFHQEKLLPGIIAMAVLAMVYLLKLNMTQVGYGFGNNSDATKQVFILSLASCAMFIYLLHGMAHRFGLVDHPGGRKLHVQPTPTVGGLAMFVTVMLVLLLENQLGGDVAVLMNCAAAMVVLGVLDDKYGLPVSLRITIQIFLSLLVIINAQGTITHLGALFGSDVNLGLFAIPFSVIALVGGINAMNMIDGADGMAGHMASITMLGVTAIFYSAGTAEFLPLSWAVLGALAGFLMFNTRLFIKRAWVFMGDAGSMWLGLVLGWFMVQMTRGEVSAEPALVLWLFGIPLIDTLSVMLRRICRKSSPFLADRTHIHFVLENAGLTVKSAVLMSSVVQMIMVGTGVLFYLLHAPAALVFWSFIVLFAAYCYCLRKY